MQETYFERALFFSWYCALGDCTFCYMSINGKQKTESNNNPHLARRSFESIFAEAIISKELDWKIEFVSGGYHSYTMEELVFLVKGIFEITGQKQWLNIGHLTKEELKLFLPYSEGYAGTIETVNWGLRKKVCPSKHLAPILKAFEHCDELGLKKAITIIIGLGETISDFKKLHEFIEEHKIDRITFYALNPHPGTPFTSSPEKEYYSQWIQKTREVFPELEIIAGAWLDKAEYYKSILEAGADNFTKLPAIREFNTKKMQEVEKQINLSGKKLMSKLTNLPQVDWDSKVDKLSEKTFSNELKNKIKAKLTSYLKQMDKN
jgi:biotin synthase-like enzyme